MSTIALQQSDDRVAGRRDVIVQALVELVGADAVVGLSAAVGAGAGFGAGGVGRGGCCSVKRPRFDAASF